MDKKIKSISKRDRFLRESSRNNTKESNKDSGSRFTNVIISECQKYTSDMSKINKIIGG